MHLPSVGIEHFARRRASDPAAEPVGRADLPGSNHRRYAWDFGKPLAVPVDQSVAREMDGPWP